MNEEQFNLLRTQLASALDDTERKIIWVHGGRATGKTTLVRQLCPDTMVMYAPRTTPAALMRQMTSLGGLVLDDYRMNDLDIEASLRSWASRGHVIRPGQPPVRMNAFPVIVVSVLPPVDLPLYRRCHLVRCQRSPFSAMLEPPTP